MLKKTFAAVLVVVLTGTLAFGFQEPAKWERFNSPEGRFNILMPKKPEVEVKDVDSAIGKLTLYAYSASTVTGYYLVSYGDYPVEPKDVAQREKVLDGVRSGVLNGLEAKMDSEKKITLGEHPGREFTAAKNVQGSDVVFNWRIFLVGRRLYQLAVVTQKGDAASPDIAKFLTSFDLNKQVAGR